MADSRWVFSTSVTSAQGKTETVQLSTNLEHQNLPIDVDDLLLAEVPSSEAPASSVPRRTSNGSSVDDEQSALLNQQQQLQQPTSSKDEFINGWKFESPFGQIMSSDILLKLTYKPDWQAIPQYTNAQRSRRLKSLLGCGRSSDGVVVEEVYTAQDIDSHHRTIASIRGIGKCEAIRFLVQPHQHESSPASVRATYETALKDAHSRAKSNDEMRMGEWQRFDQPADSLRQDADKQEASMISVTFALPMDSDFPYDPPLLWKVELPNTEYDDVYLESMTVFDGNVQLQEPTTHIYIQGYQSWSYTGSIPKGSSQPCPALPDAFSRAFNAGGSLPSTPSITIQNEKKKSMPKSTEHASATTLKPYKSDFFTCLTTSRDEGMDEIGGPAVILGWLSQHEQLGVISVDPDLQNAKLCVSHNGLIPSTGSTSTDWAYGQFVAPHHYDEEPMVHFLHAAAAYSEARPLQNGPLLTGWCSWYHYYENITAGTLRENFSRLATLQKVVPTNVAVVDDGYMTAWGDWDSLKPGKFTDMLIVKRDIEANHMRPGIWLAPYTCDKHSKLAKEHPDWIIRNDYGVPANSSNCGKFFYGLDATNPAVREHVSTCIRRAVHEWGFDVLKIDFLYAACLEGNGIHDPSMTRAQTMHLALATIRQAAGPDVFLIGCGCPIGAAIGYVDGMRVSADTGPTWYPAFPLPWWDQGTLPALRAMIRNSINRAPMGHRWWHNDPDCLLLGTSTNLTNIEVASAATIVAMTCGMLLLSDDLTKVSTARTSILTKIFPMTGVSAVVLDLHTVPDRGLPSILRLWCTDKHDDLEEYREQYRQDKVKQHAKKQLNHEATHFGRQASFRLNEPISQPNERRRSCIHVSKGVGTWTLLSVSNWSDKPAEMSIPRTAMQTPYDTKWMAQADAGGDATDESHTGSQSHSGYHIFSFWSSRYSWIAHTSSKDDHPLEPLRRYLKAHETEVLHIRSVIPDQAQYIGSDIHFSCGYEVDYFRHATGGNSVELRLKRDLQRLNKRIFVFVPIVETSHVRVQVGGKTGKWEVVANTPNEGSPNCRGRILQIHVDVQADGSENDGLVSLSF